MGKKKTGKSLRFPALSKTKPQLMLFIEILEITNNVYCWWFRSKESDLMVNALSCKVKNILIQMQVNFERSNLKILFKYYDEKIFFFTTCNFLHKLLSKCKCFI